MRKNKLLKHKCKSPYMYMTSVDTVFRNDWLNRTKVIGDEYFLVDI